MKRTTIYFLLFAIVACIGYNMTNIPFMDTVLDKFIDKMGGISQTGFIITLLAILWNNFKSCIVMFLLSSVNSFWGLSVLLFNAFFVGYVLQKIGGFNINLFYHAPIEVMACCMAVYFGSKYSWLHIDTTLVPLDIHISTINGWSRFKKGISQFRWILLLLSIASVIETISIFYIKK